MFKATKNRKLILLNLILGLSSVFCASVSTFAWFQINSQAPEATIMTKDPHLSVDNANTTGYKVNHVIGADGFIDKTSTTVTSKKGQTYDTSNNNQATSDHNFDIPSAGLGYYLVKKNPGDTYKYNYEGGGTYSWKFNEYNSSSSNYLTIPSLSTDSGDTFIIREYSYNTSTYSTVNKKVEITKDSGDFSIDSTTYEICPTAVSSTTYRIWFNKSTKKVTFEEPLDISSKNVVPKGKRQDPLKAIPKETAASNTLYFTLDSSWTADNASIRVNAWGGQLGSNTWLTVTEHTDMRYNDRTIWTATATKSFTTFIILRAKPGSSDWNDEWNRSGDKTFSSTQDFYISSTTTNSGTWTVKNYDDCRLDGWILIGKSGAESSTFGNPSTDNFDIAKAHRFSAPSDPDANLAQIAITLNPGDNFKVAYLKADSAGELEGADKLEVWNGVDNTSAILSYFENRNSGASCAVRTDISSFACTIYFTKSKNINVNPTSSVVVKAAKFNFSGVFESVDSTDAALYSTTFGSTINVTTINGLSLTIPSNYSRIGTYLYSDSDCAVGHQITTSFVADANPKTVYIKVQENAITITLKAFYVNNSGDSTGAIDDARTMTLNTQFGANSTVTASALYTLWHGTYADSLSYNSIAYTYNRIDNSTHNGAFVDGTVSDGTTLYVRYVRDRHVVTLKPSFFLSSADGGDQLNLAEEIIRYLDKSVVSDKSQTVLDGATLTSETFANCYWQDHTNGIWYVFAREGSSWYSDSDCETVFTGVVNASRPNPKTLYAKMVAYPLTTFYIDADNPGWNNCYVHMWGTLINLADGMNNALTAIAVTTDSGNKIYRASIPATDMTGFLIHNGTTTGDGNKTSDVAMTGLTGSASKYLYLGTGSPHAASFVEYKSTSATGVYVRKWNGSSFVNVADGELMHGDGVGNDYILESGLQLSSGDVIQVYDTNTSTAYGYNKYIDGNKDKHPYIATGQSGNGITLSHFTNNARFNFYVTHTGYLSIAMVPDYGNGYYIMDYNESIFSSSYVTNVKNNQGGDLSLLTQHYCGAIKMDSNDYSAIYTGYYTAGGAGHRIFIRSYLNAVDTLADTLTGASSSYATIDHGVITFTTSGRYTIQVTNKTIDISPYNVNDFFKLNSLDTSTVTGTTAEKTAAIHRQQTSLILEIPFTCNNPYASNITLLTDCSASYIGVNLYVSSSSLGTGAQIYTTLRGGTLGTPSSFYNGLTAANTSTPITDKNNCAITANRDSTYYAYVLIDYMPGVTQSDLTGLAPEFKLYLQSNQP